MNSHITSSSFDTIAMKRLPQKATDESAIQVQHAYERLRYMQLLGNVERARLKSAYPTAGCTEYTCYSQGKQGLFDHLLYSAESLHLRGILKMPAFQKGKATEE